MTHHIQNNNLEMIKINELNIQLEWWRGDKY